MKIVPVILSGGSGSRLWPLSRAGYPKQFLSLLGEESLFQQSINRLKVFPECGYTIGRAIVVCNESQRFIAAEQVRECGSKASIILEPSAKNTAPALTLAALMAGEEDSDALMVVMPSDHVIERVYEFQNAIAKAVVAAQMGTIALLGVVPDRPETGFGYIQFNHKTGKPNDIYEVESFVEKPDLISAQQFLQAGCYLWNAGMFVVKASTWISAIRASRNDIFAPVAQSWAQKSEDFDFIRPNQVQFNQSSADSIDYAVIERCRELGVPLMVVPLDAGWSDLGSWDAVWDALPRNHSGNAVVGDVIQKDSRDNLVYSSGRLVATVGVADLVIVETPDAVLVAEKKSAQDVKALVNKLTVNNREESELHRKVHRPWGWYDTIDLGRKFKVKRIQVKPGASLSLQSHDHRAEHWVVVQGVAQVHRDDQVLTLRENESTYIPKKSRHRLFNPGMFPLEIIEVQSGDYLGEDDIIRYEDAYGRS